MALDKSAVAEREALIAQALETDEGRVALAQAMVEPIRRALEYQAVGRKLLMVDELPQGALARYEKDVRSVAHVISRRGAVPDEITEGEEILVPTFEIAVNPQIRISEIKARRFYIVDRAQIKAKEAIQKEEDTNIFAAIRSSILADHTVTTTGGALTLAALNSAFAFIEQHDLTVAKIVMHASRYADVRNFGKTVYDVQPAENADQYYIKDKDLLDNPGEQIYEWKVKRSDGGIRDVIFYKATFEGANREVAGLIGTILDITERKKMEEALRSSHSRAASESSRSATLSD